MQRPNQGSLLQGQLFARASSTKLITLDIQRTGETNSKRTVPLKELVRDLAMNALSP